MTLHQAAALLQQSGVQRALPAARVLFRHFANLSDADLYGGDPSCDSPQLIDAVMRRAAGEPAEYIIGKTDFYRETYRVTPDVLIPRPETELLVTYAVEHLRPGAHILDLCTGSGCVGLSVLANTLGTTAVLTDLSEGALTVARENAHALALSARTRILRSNVLQDVLVGEYDAIVSNPPYVADSVYPTLPLSHYEPAMAFCGGEEGMDFYVAILRGYAAHLQDGGFFAFEIGYDQKDKMQALAAACGFSCDVQKDDAGFDRLAVLYRR